MPFTAYIVDAVRTAGGKKGGKLSKIHPADLGAVVVNALVERNNFDPALIEDVIFGCVSQIGAQAGNIARNVVLSSILPESVPGTTVDRQCGSSQQALHFAAQAVMSGTQDIIIAGGVEVMSLVPLRSALTDGEAAGRGTRSGENINKRYNNANFSQFEGAEIVAERFNVSKEDMELMAFNSHKRAFEATRAGKFKNEIVPVKIIDPKTGEETIFDVDEGIRWPADLNKLASLPLLKKNGGRITAGTASQITDGASAMLICNEAGLKKLGLRPRAKIVALALAGDDPVMMLAAPIPATRTVLQRAGLSINEIDLYEVNEAFASIPLAWQKQIGADLEKLNVNGGAMALGHPLGATGVKIMTTLINELERRGGRYGLQAICEGGGTANATIIEIIPRSKL